MKFLLDTHTFIWWDSEPDKLSKAVITACQDGANEIILSVISILEMQIKLQLGKLKLRLPLKELIQSQQQTNNIEILSITLKHVLAYGDLPIHHKDPFDRLLIAQAIVENAVLISHDNIFAKYPIKALW